MLHCHNWAFLFWLTSHFMIFLIINSIIISNGSFLYTFSQALKLSVMLFVQWYDLQVLSKACLDQNLGWIFLIVSKAFESTILSFSIAVSKSLILDALDATQKCALKSVLVCLAFTLAKICLVQYLTWDVGNSMASAFCMPFVCHTWKLAALSHAKILSTDQETMFICYYSIFHKHK